jgi:hypothetical protein
MSNEPGPETPHQADRGHAMNAPIKGRFRREGAPWGGLLLVVAAVLAGVSA